MKLSNNFKKFWRAANWLGLSLLALAGILSLALGQVGVVGAGDRFGISPFTGFNVLNLSLVGLAGAVLILRRWRSEAAWSFHLPRFGFDRLDFRAWRFPRFGQTHSTTNTASEPHQVTEPVCKILFIHYRAAAQDNAAANLNFDFQNEQKTYAKTNNN